MCDTCDFGEDWKCSGDGAGGWLTKGQLSGYDTGGYTGDWAGGDGRLALLHSKELVLNKDDTKNILDTVQILRQFAIKDLAQSVGDAISNGLNSLIGKALNFDSNNYGTTQVNNNTNEEQNVTINVESRKISGLAIPVESRSELLNGVFYETISRDAVTEDLINSMDVKLYVNHDPSQGTFARSKHGKGSLKLFISILTFF